jgi:hypothetical protein
MYALLELHIVNSGSELDVVSKAEILICSARPSGRVLFNAESTNCVLLINHAAKYSHRG